MLSAFAAPALHSWKVIAQLNTPALLIESAFLLFQALVLIFLLFHDWVPLGRWNNYAAKRTQDSPLHLLLTTLLAALPSAIGLWFCARYLGQPYPHGLEMLLWITYGLFVVGMLRAWWIPYLLIPDEKRAARYQVIFANTHSFLPKRNGIAPDTLHTLFHVTVVATIVLLAVRDRILG